MRRGLSYGVILVRPYIQSAGARVWLLVAWAVERVWRWEARAKRRTYLLFKLLGMNIKTSRLLWLPIFSLLLVPLGCGGSQSGEFELRLTVDDAPLAREEGAAVHSYAGVLREVQPAVVSVYSQKMADEEGFLDHPTLRQFFGEERQEDRMQRGVGSGVIVSAAGYILTNNHVIEGADRIIVEMANKGRLEAEVVGADAPTDIALLRLNGEGEDYPFAVLANSDLIEVGDVVFALGNALGIGHAVTSGIVSARGRTAIGILGEEGYEDFIQTDAAMNIGNSGGPLIDSKGRVIGINTAIASPGGGNVGIGFAIPINMARDVMENLIQYGEVRRGYLGISLRDLAPGIPLEYGAPLRDEDAALVGLDGALVVDVVAKSPAAEAGLQEGDFVVELNGNEIGSASELRLEVARQEPGTTVDLGIIRDEERINVSATLANRADARAEQQAVAPEVEAEELLPGLMVAPLTPEIRAEAGLPEGIQGLIVTEVEEGSPHSEVFSPGAVILQVNQGIAIDVASARARIQPGRNLILMFHQGAIHHVVVEIQ
jgi:serine protease Do